MGRHAGTSPGRIVLALVAAIGTGCGPSVLTVAPCVTSDDCDDGVFCNGVERCVSDASGERFCSPDDAPCGADWCDESGGGCAGCVPSDADGDGHAALHCGGDDCDDADATHRPGARETCDPSGDEDCDPRTFGLRDADHDGHVSASCCNDVVGGSARCGDDCDDASAVRFAGALDACNGVDEDCDGAVDEAGSDACHLPFTDLVACVAGECALVSCEAGHLDCNGVSSDGCEADVESSRDDCGGCGATCLSDQVCMAGVCVAGLCGPGARVCFDRCVGDDWAGGCGPDCVPCPTPPNGYPTCEDGVCGVRCSSDYAPGEVDGVPTCLSSATRLEGLSVYAAGAPLVLSPAFSRFSSGRDYEARVPRGAETVTVAPTLSSATFRIGTDTFSPPASSPAVVIPLGVTELELVVAAPSGATDTYTIRLRRGYEGTRIFEGDAGDLAGVSVDIDGDLLVLGAPLEDSGTVGVDGDEGDASALDSGAVYVLRREAGTWVRDAFVKASNTDAGDHFGATVALRGNTLVVGAPYEDGSGASEADDSLVDSGAVYVFERLGAAWSQVAYLKSWAPRAEDLFGTFVDVHGATIAIGAPQDDGTGRGVAGDPYTRGATSRGAVYVFAEGPGGWLPDAYLRATSGSTYAFGSQLALFGDRIAVPSPSSSVLTIFERVAGRWSVGAVLATEPTTGGTFVERTLRVALADQTMVVGSVSGGWASVASATAFGWSWDFVLRQTGIGAAVGLDGDVVALTRSVELIELGAGAGGAWEERVRVPGGTAVGEGFGASVAVSGTTVVVGFQGDDSPPRPGGVFIVEP